MRVGLIGCVRRVWAPRGVKIEQAVEYVYQWSYLNLAVNGRSGELRWDWTDNMKAASLAPVVEQWSKQDIQVLIWDRAPGHRGELYEPISIERIEQPPYSPQLNPAERVFEYLRARIEGEVYGSVQAKQQAVEDELHLLVQQPERVRSLAGWSWIQDALAQLPE
jgi:hypothetical protein